MSLELTAYIKDSKGYNYPHHAEVGSSNAEFVTDEVVDRSSIFIRCAATRSKRWRLMGAM
ncbi:MAG: hypothetical protein MOB07_08510 [Acidobacteria bacterium]|nr:hypothetical protein [Acidobacteriota bacterium]